MNEKRAEDEVDDADGNGMGQVKMQERREVVSPEGLVNVSREWDGQE